LFKNWWYYILYIYIINAGVSATNPLLDGNYEKKKLQRFIGLGTSYHLQKIKFIYSCIYDVLFQHF